MTSREKKTEKNSQKTCHIHKKSPRNRRMPQWSKGVQGWVNGWVNINNKYSNYTFSDDEDNNANHRTNQPSASPAHHHQNFHSNEKDVHFHGLHPHNQHEYYQRSQHLMNQEHESTGDSNNNNDSSSNYISAQNLHGPLHRRVPYPSQGPVVIGDGRAILNQRPRPPYNYQPPSNIPPNDSKNTYGKTASFASVTTADTTAVSSQSYVYDATHHNASDFVTPNPNNFHKNEAQSMTPSKTSNSKKSTNTPVITRSSGSRRGLRRTNSHSDLMKKKATDKRTAQRSLFSNDKNPDNHHQPNTHNKESSKQSENNSSSSIHVSDTSGSITVTHSNVVEDLDSQVHNNKTSQLQPNSLQSPANSVVVRRSSAPEVSTTGQYINEAAFASQQYQIQMRAKQQQSQQQEQMSSNTMTTATATASDPPKVKDTKNKGKKKREKVKSIRRKKKDINNMTETESLPQSAPAPIIENNLPAVSEFEQQLYPRQTNVQQIPDTNILPNPYINFRASYPPGVPVTHIQPHNMTPPNSKSMVIPFETTLEEGNEEHHEASQVTFCAQCDEMERNILALQADVEYLRATALQNEYICAECENQIPSSSSQNNINSSSASVASGKASVASSKRKSKKHRKLLANPDKLQESIALAEASQRLIDVNARHKRQIEQMTRETVSIEHV